MPEGGRGHLSPQSCERESGGRHGEWPGLPSFNLEREYVLQVGQLPPVRKRGNSRRWDLPRKGRIAGYGSSADGLVCS